MGNVDSTDHLKSYITEKLPTLVPGIFDGAPDNPDFTVDQRFMPPKAPAYSV
jgi:hypothetical protein